MLRAELISLKSETKSNEEIGRQITVKVMQVAQPNEYNMCNIGYNNRMISILNKSHEFQGQN